MDKNGNVQPKMMMIWACSGMDDEILSWTKVWTDGMYRIDNVVFQL